MEEVILKLENVNKYYETKVEKIHILKNINLEVRKGDFISIMGKSGSGKTTLLNILGMLDEKTDGNVYINGRKIEKLSEKEITNLRRKTLGFVFQFHHLLNEFSALENVMLPQMIISKNILKTKEKARKILDIVDLKHRYSHKSIELSGGEKQRVAIARSLINDPFIILADEPTGNLDDETSKKIHELFLKLNREYNQTIIVVTHSLELANLAKRKLELKNGVLEEYEK